MLEKKFMKNLKNKKFLYISNTNNIIWKYIKINET